jgi:hypothetical protein
MGVVGGAEATDGAGRAGGAGAGSARTRGPVGGAEGDGAGAGGGVREAGENSDSNGTTTVGSSGDLGASGTPAA